jgi:acyl carrier protein
MTPPPRHTEGTTGPDAASVLDVTARLLAELRPEQATAKISLDSALDRDLGLDSLALVELLDRLEAAFDVRLPERLLETAATPGDLLRALADGARRGRRERRVRPRLSRQLHRPSAAQTSNAAALRIPPAPPTRPLTDTATLVEVLDWHVGAHPHALHVRLLGDGPNGGDDVLNYAQLQREARSVAAGLWERDVQAADTVAIMLPTSRDFFVAFVGILLAGAVPVPIYPPVRPSQLEDHLRRQARILENARAAALVTVPEARPLARLLRGHVETLRFVVGVDELRGADAAGVLGVVAEPADIALLQYTSGSTANPKGVVLTHGNLLANLRAMGEAVGVTPADIFVSWLPLYHDMGPIGAWLGSLCHGFELDVMPPLAFLAHPARWLWAIHDHRASLSGGPNFAYELCLRRVADAEIEDLDLTCWRWAFNGAEAVSASTIERFHDRFAPHGLRPDALAPVYGLAEASVGLTFPPIGRGPLIDRIDRRRFARSGRAKPTAKPGTAALRVVSCGRPLLGHEIRVVDAAGNEVGERREGRIEFTGPSATNGYYRNPEASARLFDDGWLDSGDLGYLAGGELYVTGRVKDVIVRAGRTLHPDELEEGIGDLPGIRKGCVAGVRQPRSRHRDRAGGGARRDPGVIAGGPRSLEPQHRGPGR